MVEQRDIDIILNNPIDWELFRNKTVLVTGATGRLGMYIVEAINKADTPARRRPCTRSGRPVRSSSCIPARRTSGPLRRTANRPSAI